MKALHIPITGLLFSAFLFAQCQTTPPLPEKHDPVWPDRVPAGQISFEDSVKPILEYHCLECHNSTHSSEFAGLNLETRKLALSTGRSAPVIIPGQPDESRFIEVLELDPHHVASMPAEQEKVQGVRLKLLRKWIAQGAEWPDDVHLEFQ